MYPLTALSTKTAFTWLFFVFLLFIFADGLHAEESGKVNCSHAATCWRYSVRPGDTLIQISNRYLQDPKNWRVLQSINRVTNPYRMLPGTTIQVPLILLRQTPIAAEVLSVSGQVQIKLPEKAQSQPVVGQQLQIGTKVQTAENSKLLLKFADGTVLSVEPNSILVLDSMSMYSGGGMVDTKLRLQSGSVAVRANPNHVQGNQTQIITPTAVAAVRGTEFRVRADDVSAKEETLQGKVALRAENVQVDVSGGFGTIAERGKAPLTPVALLAAPELDRPAVKVERLPFHFTVKPVGAESAWHAQITPEAEPDAVAFERLITQPKLIVEDLSDGKYMLKIRAQDQVGLQGYETKHAFTVKARPFAPLAIAPIKNSVVRSDAVTLQWSEVLGSAQYLLEVAKDQDFQDIVLRKRVNTNRYSLDNLAVGAYFWRIASIDNALREFDEVGPMMSAQGFSYKPMPGKPDMAGVQEDFSCNKVLLQLPLPDGGLHYEMLLSNDESMQDVLWRGESVDGKAEFDRPPSGEKYFSARLVEADGTAGPYATRVLDVPPPKTQWWPFMLIPFVFAL